MVILELSSAKMDKSLSLVSLKQPKYLGIVGILSTLTSQTLFVNSAPHVSLEFPVHLDEHIFVAPYLPYEFPQKHDEIVYNYK